MDDGKESQLSSQINAEQNRELVFQVEGLDCADCALHVEEALRRTPGIGQVSLDFGLARLRVAPADGQEIRPEVERLAAWASEGAPAEKPLLVTEIGACALPGCHDYGRAQWSEEFQADYFREACEAILGNPRFAGLALWQLFDTRTYVNAGSVRTKPLGFNFAGLSLVEHIEAATDRKSVV